MAAQSSKASQNKSPGLLLTLCKGISIIHRSAHSLCGTKVNYQPGGSSVDKPGKGRGRGKRTGERKEPYSSVLRMWIQQPADRALGLRIMCIHQ